MNPQFMQMLQRALNSKIQVGTPPINGDPAQRPNAIPYPMNMGIDRITNDLPNIVSGMSQVPKWEQERTSRTQQAYAPPTIKPRSPVSGRDAIPMALIAGLSALLGADENDLAQGLQGFVGARQGVVDQEFQLAQQADTLRRQGLLNEAGVFGEKISAAEKAKADNDKWLRELKVLDIKGKQQADVQNAITNRASMNIEARRGTEEYKAKKEMVMQYLKTVPNLTSEEGRRTANASLQAALAKGDIDLDVLSDPDVLKALSGETYQGQKFTAQTEGIIKDNFRKDIQNFYLPFKEQTDIMAKYEQAMYTQVKRNNYDKYLDAIAARQATQDYVAQVNTGDKAFDNATKAWELQNRSRIDGLLAQIKGHADRIEELRKERDKKLAAGEDEGDLGQQISQQTRMRDAARKEHEALLKTAPLFSGFSVPSGPPGVVQPPPTGSVNLPPVQGNPGIDKSGKFQSFGTDMNGKQHTENDPGPKTTAKPVGVNPKGELTGDMAGGKRLPGGGVIFEPTDKKKTTTTKKTPTKPVAKDTKKPVKLKSGWGT